MRILKNVFQVSGIPFGYAPHGPIGVNVFAVRGENVIVLVDCGGSIEELEVIDEWLRYWNLKDYPISHILITHAHTYHMGNAYIFRKRGAKIVAGIDDAEYIETGDHRVIDSGPFKLRPYHPCIVDLKVKDGDIIESGGLRFEVISAPGHTPGSTIYKLVDDGKTILFTGDVLKVGPECKSSFLGWTGSAGYDREKYFETIKKISKMHADVILPGEYHICLKDGWKILQDSYLRALLEWRQPAEYDD
jgi:glyoxylase-like metal-dependent hydrolase (beta-lactamase superfamily II)